MINMRKKKVYKLSGVFLKLIFPNKYLTMNMIMIRQGRQGTERERRRKSEWRPEKEKNLSQRCLCLHFFSSSFSKSLTAFGYYGPLFTSLPMLSPTIQSPTHSILSLITCPKHFYSSVLYLFRLLLYLLMLTLHFILFFFLTLPFNYLLNLLHWLHSHVIIFFPPSVYLMEYFWL